MKKNCIITISRQFGSGGREIGKMVAEQLGIPFYDKKIIDDTAKESGFAPEYIERAEQATTISFLYNLAMNGYYTQPLTDQLFVAESNVIKSLADNGPCVIVGRCADYVLQCYNCFNVFVYSDDESRIKRIEQEYGIEPAKILETMRSRDKARKRHYKYYTEQNWGVASNYHLCVNSDFVGIENAAKMIVMLASQG